MESGRTILKEIVKRQLKLFRHVMRKGELECLVTSVFGQGSQKVSRQMAFIGRVIRKDELEEVVLTGYAEGISDPGQQGEIFLTYQMR